MSLDLFASNIDDAVNYAARTSGAELPSTFSDNFNDAWNKGYLVNQSISDANRRARVIHDYADEVYGKTGDQGIRLTPAAAPNLMNERIRQLKAKDPTLDISELQPDEVQRRADELGVRQLADSAHADSREKTFGGKVGSFLGTAAAAVADPVNLIAFPLAAPESLGVLGTALAWGGIGGGSQAVIEALNAPGMERIQPGYGASGQPITNILEAGIGGAVLGGGLKGLSALWRRQKTGAWPRSVRDAGNVVESEAQIAATNPLPGVEGEAAHRTALTKAIDDIANGRPVDVENIVTPEQAAHIEAWHGSPHDFDRFDTSKIGTGEGAQAYGRGLYFAENQGVARSYQLMGDATINGRPYDINNPVHKAVSMVDEFGSRAAAISEVEARIAHDPGDFYGDVLRHLESGKALPELDSAGKMYKVRITADKESMIDLDKPLNQQNPQVQEAVKRAMGIDYHGNFDVAKSERMWAQFQSADGKTAVRQGFIASDDALVAQRLSDAGIPGLKYLDEGSRGQGDGTRNFVIFNDKHVQITHKNGKPVNADIRQNVVDQAMGLPPKQPELALAPPEPPPATTAPKHQTGQALDEQLTPDNIEKLRADPALGDTVSRDLDKLMLERPGLEVPTGVTVDAEGRTVPTTRKVEDVVAEADARSAAAKEIELCVGPYPSEAA